MKKTLGGDRLGSGSKMQVEMRNYERSTHDLGYIWRSTMSAGTLVPFLSIPALPGDTFDIDLDCVIKTHPTIGPLFGSFKVQLDVFLAPIRLYQGAIHNNKLGIGRKMSDVKLPIMNLTASPIPDGTLADRIDITQINPSALLAYLGIRGVGATTTTTGPQIRPFNAVPLITYWDIYKNYYANKQEEIGAFISATVPPLEETIDNIMIDGENVIQDVPTPPGVKIVQGSQMIIASTGGNPKLEWIMFATDKGVLHASDIFTITVEVPGSITATYDTNKYGTLQTTHWRYAFPNELNASPVEVVTFPLSQIDNMREFLLNNPGSTTAKVINLTGLPYVDCFNTAKMLCSQQGLGLKTYNSDLFNNWLKTEWIDGPGGINQITAIDTTGGSFTLDTLNLSKKVYDMLNRIAVSGGTYDDWVDTVYTHDRFVRIETPVYMGGLIKELVFQEVVSNTQSDTSQGAQPLGTLAGKGIMSGKHKGGKIVIKVDEPSYIMGIISLTPRIDYSQGNNWDVNLKTFDDFHKPALDEIGFQELITEQMAWWTTNWLPDALIWQQQSAGKQPAWINYMTNINKTYGNFAILNNEMFMTLNRRYEAYDPGPNGKSIKDLTTYIDPTKFNQIFAQTSLDAQNFWAQIAVDITARRKMSAKIMPNL